MKKSIIKYFVAAAVLATAIVGCKDKDFDDYKIQSVDNHGSDQKMVYVGVTATSNDNFLADAVVPSDQNETLNLIPVVLGSRDVASQDIHVQMVVALDSLDSYNEANETDYLMPGGAGSPAFTLVNDGLVTIPKGSSVGYLQIITKTADYFGEQTWVFPYKIGSIQEPGYAISGNFNYGIVAVLPKNPYDGVYKLFIETDGWAAYSIADGPAQAGNYSDLSLVTTGPSSVSISTASFGNLQPALTPTGGQTGFGAASPVFTFDPTTNKLTDVENSGPDSRNRAFHINPAAPATDNVYDPDTGKVTLNYIMTQDGRPDQKIIMKLTYSKSR